MTFKTMNSSRSFFIAQSRERSLKDFSILSLRLLFGRTMTSSSNNNINKSHKLWISLKSEKSRTPKKVTNCQVQWSGDLRLNVCSQKAFITLPCVNSIEKYLGLKMISTCRHPDKHHHISHKSRLSICIKSQSQCQKMDDKISKITFLLLSQDKSFCFCSFHFDQIKLGKGKEISGLKFRTQFIK